MDAEGYGFGAGGGAEFASGGTDMDIVVGDVEACGLGLRRNCELV